MSVSTGFNNESNGTLPHKNTSKTVRVIIPCPEAREQGEQGEQLGPVAPRNKIIRGASSTSCFPIFSVT